MLSSAEEIISFLFTGAVAELDIPAELAELAELKYQEVGNWLGSTGGPGWAIYPQGSFRLGTVVQPSGPDGEYDIDLVCLWGAAPEGLVPPVLKDTVGSMLDSYMQWKAAQQAADGPAECVPSRRCWTLRYPDEGFHMDVLPAAHDTAPPSIRLTDETITDWHYSNPIGYAQWFRGRSEEMTRLLAKEARAANVADVPEWRVRSTLQRLVQVLKWHCAAYFAGHLDDRPPSILSPRWPRRPTAARPTCSPPRWTPCSRWGTWSSSATADGGSRTQRKTGRISPTSGTTTRNGRCTSGPG